MGKKIIGVIAFAAIAVAAGWNYQQNTNEVKLSDLALENVEALARGESGTDYCDDFTTMRCMSSSGTVWMDMYHM
ncbi:NVEALA domain-containing protein [uncultured Parabacteroides sp.]|uniref:NVEALA domain-containing protein n=1 Tax=uncultured Parabacteroides sp. TaxID=512312 RepID=UPI0025E5C359|nr:NVEALA domain-containing protein [uncultured Parabacteroides sp.]